MNIIRNLSFIIAAQCGLFYPVVVLAAPPGLLDDPPVLGRGTGLAPLAVTPAPTPAISPAPSPTAAPAVTPVPLQVMPSPSPAAPAPAASPQPAAAPVATAALAPMADPYVNLAENPVPDVLNAPAPQAFTSTPSNVTFEPTKTTPLPKFGSSVLAMTARLYAGSAYTKSFTTGLYSLAALLAGLGIFLVVTGALPKARRNPFITKQI